MKHDDLPVLVCKVLKYVYECNKAGKPVDVDCISAEALGINYHWWTQLMLVLNSEGLVDGITNTETLSGKQVVLGQLAITLKGTEYLEENSTMRKAYAWLKDIRGLLPV